MKLILTPKAYLQLKYYTNLVSSEISGMAKSKIDKDENIIVQDVIIFKQEVSSATTDIDDQAQAKFLAELMKKDEKLEDWNIWWHSHADMDVFWSGTDDKTIEGHSGLQSYLISLVTNKAGEYKARLDVFPKDTSPFKKVMFNTYELEVEVQLNKEIEKQKIKLEKIAEKALEEVEKLETFENKRLEKKCELEIKQKVTEKKYFQQSFNNKHSYSKTTKKEKWKWWEDEYYKNDYEDLDKQIKDEYDRELEGDTPIDEIGFQPRYNSR